jgi:hypothetical protein
MLLEVSQYLENYLVPHFDPDSASFEHVMSIVLMVNEKFRSGVPAWPPFHAHAVRVTPGLHACVRQGVLESMAMGSSGTHRMGCYQRCGQQIKPKSLLYQVWRFSSCTSIDWAHVWDIRAHAQPTMYSSPLITCAHECVP